jgi:hypothetical protein
MPRGIVVEGRPFLVDDVPRVAGLGARGGWSALLPLDATPASRAERKALVRHYTEWALAEHASIASFARFTLQLLALGAPSDIVNRAIAATADETRHARIGFGLVRALSGTVTSPAELSIDHALEGDNTLEGVLRLVAREGLIGETLAALEVRCSANLAKPRALRAVLASVADDEAQHAELAFVFAAWALEQEPTLASVLETELADWDAPALPVVRGLERWGILDEATRRAVREAAFSQVVLPLVRRLSARQPRSRSRP